MLSPSGAHRWLVCTPSARQEEQFPDTSSGAAEEGTLAHELAEAKLRHYFFTPDFGKRKLTYAIKKLKENPAWDDEMQGYTDEYLDYVKGVAVGLASMPTAKLEARFDLTKYIPEGSGSADCVLISGDIMQVIDFKYGKSPNGRVLAERNPQMMLYALGAYETYNILYPIKRVRLSIMQPRLPDGISEWECSLDELLEFGEYVKKQAALAFAGEGEFKPGPETCKWCKARHQCRARAEENVKLAFAISQKPPLISAAEAGEYLRQGEDIAKWLSELKDWALEECLSGKEVPGWKAVEGRGSRDWTDMDKAFEVLTKEGINEAILWERKPLTLAQVEKAVGKKDFTEYVGDLVVKKPGKPALVKESDKRDAITNKVSAAEAFGENE